MIEKEFVAFHQMLLLGRKKQFKTWNGRLKIELKMTEMVVFLLWLNLQNKIPIDDYD